MSQLANLNNLIANPDFQSQVQANIRNKAKEHNSSIIYRDEQGRMVREYPGSGQLYEQDANQQLTLLSVQGQPVAGALPISLVEADRAQTEQVLAPAV